MSGECEIGVHAHPCSALVDGLCKNGFPFGRGCIPFHVLAPNGKDHWHAVTPPCCDEEFVVDGIRE